MEGKSRQVRSVENELQYRASDKRAQEPPTERSRRTTEKGNKPLTGRHRDRSPPDLLLALNLFSFRVLPVFFKQLSHTKLQKKKGCDQSVKQSTLLNQRQAA